MMDVLRAFLEQQPLLALFVVVGLGYALGAGAVLFVGLAAGMLAPKAVPPALVGSLGLVLFVYGVGIQYGKMVFSGIASPFGLKVNGLVLLSHLAGIGVCWLGSAAFSVA
jgi:putative transport protein